MLLLKCSLKTSRPHSWFALSIVLAAGCAAQTETTQAGAEADGGDQETDKNTVQFSLSEGQNIGITISTPGIALAVVVIRDGNGNVLQTQKNTSNMDPNPITRTESIGFVWDGCDDNGRPQPTGIYTAEVTATDGDPLHVDCAFTPAAATETITIRGNLDSNAQPATFDPNNAQTTSNFDTVMTVHNSFGNPIQLSVYFSKNDAANTQPGELGDWSYHAITDGANLVTEGDGTTPATPGKPTEVAGGTLRFDSCGVLISNVKTLNTFNPKGAASPQPLTFDFGPGAAVAGAGVDGMTQFPATSSASFVTADGSTDYIACVATHAGADAGSRAPATPDASPAAVAATTSITILGNLDQTALPTSFDPANAQMTSNFNASATIFDLLSRPIQIGIYFCKNAIASPGDSGDWTYHVVTAPQNLASADNSTCQDLWGRPPAEIATGTLSFDSGGRLLSNVTSGTAFFVPRGATAPQMINFNFGNGTASGGSGLDGLTQYAANSAISFLAVQ
jgi:hypothetical protein